MLIVAVDGIYMLCASVKGLVASYVSLLVHIVLHNLSRGRRLCTRLPYMTYILISGVCNSVFLYFVYQKMLTNSLSISAIRHVTGVSQEHVIIITMTSSKKLLKSCFNYQYALGL